MINEEMTKELIKRNDWVINNEPDVSNWSEEDQDLIALEAFMLLSQDEKGEFLDEVAADPHYIYELYYHMEVYIKDLLNMALWAIQEGLEAELDMGPGL